MTVDPNFNRLASSHIVGHATLPLRLLEICHPGGDGTRHWMVLLPLHVPPGARWSG
jgi:hypothetical protein